MDIPLWPFVVCVLVPLLAFAVGIGVRGVAFARNHKWLVVSYYLLLIVLYGTVFLALAAGATESDAVVWISQSIGCFMFPLGLGLSIWLLISAMTMQKQINGHVCHKCAYDLAGNVSGLCPQCGTAIQKAPKPDDSTPPADGG